MGGGYPLGADLTVALNAERFTRTDISQQWGSSRESSSITAPTAVQRWMVMGMADFCENCKYRQFLTRAYDIRIDDKDCDKVNTHFCEKMRKRETVVIIDAGCADKTMYHKGFQDGYESVNIVRCKDCKKYRTDACAMSYMDRDENMPHCWARKTDFCSQGERKDND